LKANLSLFTECSDLENLLKAENSVFNQKFKKLTSSLVEVINDWNQVSFLPLDINDKNNMAAILSILDKSNGYSLSPVFSLSGEIKLEDHYNFFNFVSVSYRSKCIGSN
jgi:hypothetical protein